MKAKTTLNRFPAWGEGGRPPGPSSIAQRRWTGAAWPRCLPDPGEERGVRSLVLCFAHPQEREGRVFGAQGVSVHAPSPAVTPLTGPVPHLEELPHTSGYLGRISPGSQHGLPVPFNMGSFLPVRRLASCLDSPEEAAVFIDQGRELCPLILPNPHKAAAAAEAGTKLPPTRWKRGGGGRQSKPQADPKLPNPLQIASGSFHLPSWDHRAPPALSLLLQTLKLPQPSL